MKTEGLHVVRPRAAGLDVHKMEITATVRLCEGEGEPVVETRCFSTRPSGLEEIVAWLTGHGVEATVMEGTGIYWQAPFAAVEAAGIEAILVHARQVKQLNNSLSFCPYRAGRRGSLSLARFSRIPGSSSRVPTTRFRKVGSCRRSTRNGFADSGLDVGPSHVCRHRVG